MPKYTKKFKIKFVLEYLSGEWGGLKSYKISGLYIWRWNQSE